MYSPENRNNPREYYQNKNPELSFKNNTVLNNNHQQRKLKNKDFIPLEFNDKEINKNFLLNAPVYRSLKTDNFMENYNYMPSINNKSKKQIKLKEIYNIRQNEGLSPKSQSSLNQRIINNYISYYIDEKNGLKKNKSSINKKFAIKKFKNNKSNMSALTNSNGAIYSTIYSTNLSPQISLRRSNVEENVLSKNKYKKIFLKNKNKKTILKKKIYNSNKNINNLEFIENDIDNKYYENNHLSNKKINIASSYKSIKNYMNQKPEKYNRNSEKIKIYDNNTNNKYYYKIETNSSKKNNKIIESYNKNMNMNHSYKSKNIVTLHLNPNSISFQRNDLFLNSTNISNIPSYFNSKFRKGLDILKKIITNQKKKIFLSIKYKLLKQKSFTNYNNYIKKIKVYNYLSNMPMNIYPSLRNYTIENEGNSKKRIIIKKKEKEEYTKPLRSIINQNIYQINYRDILNENSKLKNINFIIMQENDELNKKIEFLLEQNKKSSKKPNSNNFKIENKKLNNKLKNIYIKYLITKKIYQNNKKLKEKLKEFHKKAYKMHFQEKKKNLLLKLINNKINFNKKILRKFFYKYYYKSKILYYKEKYNFNKIKKNNNYNKKDKRKLLLKIINKKIINNINNNNIILKSVFKQWFLRTKLINMKIMLVKEENNKNIIFPIETLNLLKDKGKFKELIINNLKKENLKKGIEKLNDIFNHNNEKDKINNLKSEDNDNDDYNDLNPLINNDINQNISNNNITENLTYKSYTDKFNENDDWIIEEKEEEQIEDIGESHTIKKDIEDIIEDNNKSNTFFNNESL